ncbi:MAG: hypothetical protein GXP47_05300 [Acidobacteria bacterium]|nr:hypothetical protein [Acidobacteriota bacterium]
MTGGHLTPRRFPTAFLIGALVILLAALGGLWWRHATALPQARAGSFLADSPALRLPGPPEGLVVLARPGGWARFLARNPERRVLLDPGWWRSLSGGPAGAGPRAAVPGAAAALLLDQFRHGVTVAWWQNAWIVQGAVPGGGAARRLAGMLPQSLAGRWRLREGVLRIASDPALLEGDSWTVAPSVDPTRRLACWLWFHGSEWPGHWEGPSLVLEHGNPDTIALPDPRGTVLAHLEDGRQLLAVLGNRLPVRGVLAGVAEKLDGLLARPVGFWLRRLEGGSALPHARMALDLGLLEGEDGEQVADSLREVLCPLGCTTEEAGLSDGRPARRWRSALGSWWAIVLPGDAVVAATGQGQLETLLGARTGWPGGDWAVVGGGAAASSLEALASARLLEVFGILRPGQLSLLRRVAVPLRGVGAVSWQRDPGGVRIELEPAPSR